RAACAAAPAGRKPTQAAASAALAEDWTAPRHQPAPSTLRPPVAAIPPTGSPARSSRLPQQFQHPGPGLLDRAAVHLARGQHRADAGRAAVRAGTRADELERLPAQVLAPLEQRQRQPDAARVVVVEEQRRREPARGIRQRLAAVARAQLAAPALVGGGEPGAVAAAHGLLQVAPL